MQRLFVDGDIDPDRAFIRSLPDDNPYLDLEAYERSLSRLSEIVRQQLRNGRWDLRPDGGLFRREWFEGRFIGLDRLPGDLRVIRCWDLAATEPARGRDPDYTVGLLLARDRDGICYVIDVVRARETPLGIQRLIARTAAADRDLAYHRGWPLPAIRMEQEPGASGVSLVDTYRREVLPEYDFSGVRSSGSKESRAMPVSVRAEAAQIFLTLGPWNGAFLDELCGFPHGRHDDQVDALSGAYAYLVGGERRHARVRRARILA